MTEQATEPKERTRGSRNLVLTATLFTVAMTFSGQTRARH